ncbi:hypothetical protein ZWY2020_056922 [Hordeum vulgare]|nr:hypothetical protein ZWY2020_056922 [Hordeum vulgare]
MEEDEGEGKGKFEIHVWAGMPSNALFVVFGKLDMADILTGVGRACRAWRRLDMTHHEDILETEEADAMARAAGTLQYFCTDTFVSDALLTYIFARSLAKALPSLFYTCDIVLLV